MRGDLSLARGPRMPQCLTGESFRLEAAAVDEPHVSRGSESSHLLEDATMEELSKQLSERVGIDQGTADKISALLQGNMGEMQGLLSGEGQGLVQLLQKVGIDEAVAQKVVAFLKENCSNLAACLEQEGGIFQKAKEMLGGVLAGKGSS
jgi:hypothetical protein